MHCTLLLFCIKDELKAIIILKNNSYMFLGFILKTAVFILFLPFSLQKCFDSRMMPGRVTFPLEHLVYKL